MELSQDYCRQREQRAHCGSLLWKSLEDIQDRSGEGAIEDPALKESPGLHSTVGTNDKKASKQEKDDKE